MKKYSKIIAAMLAVMISAGTTSIYALTNKTSEESESETSGKKDNDGVKETSLRETSDDAQAKNETVYVMTDANGKKTKTIVSDWLKNASGADTISDFSNLSDIQNVKFDGGYTADGFDITWSANGGDIYYKGYSESELPVDINITYTLDGKKIAPNQLAGKSGKVTVRYDYKNNSKKTVQINGKKEEMYTPFMMSTGVLLDASKFKNVTVKNGKVISDGDRLIVVGCALPGLTDSLDLTGKDEIDIPEYFEFTADVSDFEMKTTITAGTSSIFSDLELDDIADMNELQEKIDEITDAADKLCSGSKELCTGLETLRDSTGTLTEGVNDLVNGDIRLDDGINTLADGTQQLYSGAKTLDDSTGTLSNGINSAKNGSDEVLKGFKEAQKGMTSLTAGAASLSEGLDSADKGARQVNDGAKSLADGSEKLAAGASTLNDGAASVAAGTSQLSQSAKELDAGADQLAAGVSSAKKGADILSAGIEQAGTAAASLANGIARAGAGVDQLAEGAAAGAQELGEMSQQINGAADSLDATIVYNQQVIAGLQAMLAAYAPDSPEYQQLSVMIGTLQKTVEGQQEISTGLKEGASTSEDRLDALTVGISQLHAAFKGDGTSENLGLINGSAALSAAFTSAEDASGLVQGAKTLAGGLDQLDSGAAGLAYGTEKLVNGADAIDGGAQQLASSTGTLSASALQLADGTKALLQGTKSLSDGITTANTGAVALSSGSNALSEGLTKLEAGEVSLNEGLSKLATGGTQLKNGTGTLYSSVGQLNDGAQTLKSGSGDLLDGLFTLRTGTASLTDGVNKLADGSKELDNGLSKFKKQGLDKIVEAYNGDLKPLCDRLEMLTQLSRDYKNFSGAANGVETDVKFIYETDAIKSDK